MAMTTTNASRFPIFAILSSEPVGSILRRETTGCLFEKVQLSKAMEKDISCPKCKAAMTFQGVKSVGAGNSRPYNVEVYLCSKCGCNGRYDESSQKIVEITY